MIYSRQENLNQTFLVLGGGHYFVCVPLTVSSWYFVKMLDYTISKKRLENILEKHELRQTLLHAFILASA